MKIPNDEEFDLDDALFGELLKKLREMGDELKELSQVHDAYSQTLWADKVFAEQFINAFLPEIAKRYDAKNVDTRPTVFFDKSQNKIIADAIWRLESLAPGESPLYLPIVFEFKTTGSSKEDRFAYLQVLGYWISAMERELSESETGIVPQALAVVVYTGTNPNRRLGAWRELFPLAPGCGEYGVDFRVEFINLTDLYVKGLIKGESLLEMGCSALGCAGARRIVEDRFELQKKLFAFLKDPRLERKRKWEIFWSTTFYCARNGVAFGDMTKAQMIDLIKGARSGNLEEKMRTILEVMTGKSAEQYLEEGELKGELKEARKSAIRQLARRFGEAPETMVEKLANVETLDGLREFEDEIYNSSSLIEVESAIDNILLAQAIK